MFFNCSLIHPTVMIRRSAFEPLRYPTEFPAAEDYALWLSIVSTSAGAVKMANLPGAPILKLRKHAANVSKTYRDRQRLSVVSALSSALRSIGLHVPHFYKNLIPFPIISFFAIIILARNPTIYWRLPLPSCKASPRFLLLPKQNWSSNALLRSKSISRYLYRRPRRRRRCEKRSPSAWVRSPRRLSLFMEAPRSRPSGAPGCLATLPINSPNCLHLWELLHLLMQNPDPNPRHQNAQLPISP